jgi:hypothetical protein
VLARVTDAVEGSLRSGDGLVGFGVCALERLPRPGRACVAAVIDELDARRAARWRVAWFTPAEDLHVLPLVLQMARRMPRSDDRARIRGDRFASAMATGVDHLCGASPRGRRQLDARPHAGRIAERVLAVVLRRPGPDPGALRVVHGRSGIARHAAERRACHRERAWEREALAIAQLAATRPLDDETARIRDAGLCHGAAGLLHVFNRLFQRTRSEIFLKTSRAWTQRTLEMRQRGSGIAGFTAIVSSKWDEPKHPRDESGVLAGAAGIGLALLAATTGIAPAWDRMLLLS